MTPILMATNNIGKLREAAAILAPLGLAVISLEQAGLVSEPEETGTNFTENAAIKARALAALYGGPVLADDSGLCVDTLGGAPGVWSKDYGMPEAKNAEGQVGFLLREMDGKADRAAHFVCVVHCILPDGREITAQGYCHGAIAMEPRGGNGFGYDPVFELPCGKTLAEVTAEEKNRVSHRAAALRDFAKQWNNSLGESS